MEIKSVVAIVSNPNPHDPTDTGRAAVGHYGLEGRLLIMTDPDGKPVRGSSGEKITQMLQRDDDPSVVAKRLTLRIHRASRGDGMDFNRPLVYPRSGVA